MDEISVVIDDIDKIHIYGDKKPHNGKSITRIEVSPNEKCLVTYSEDDESIVCWNVESSKGEGPLTPDFTSNKVDNHIEQICVSDNMELVYTYEFLNRKEIKIRDMKNEQEIQLGCGLGELGEHEYCTFNLNSADFILHGSVNDYDLLMIYSTQTKNNKWWCKRMYNIPKDFKLISVPNYDNNIYLFSNNFIYEWNLLTEKRTRIFGNDETKYDYKKFRKDIRISIDKKFIYIRIKDKIVIYSIELEIPIASLDINNDIQLYNLMNRIILNLHLLLPLLSTNSKIWNFVMKYCWKECLDQNEQLQFEISCDNIQTKTKYAFQILDGYVWKAELKKKIANMNFVNELYVKIIEDLNSDEFNDNKRDEKIIEYLSSDEFDDAKKINMEAYKKYEHLNIHLFSPYMNTIRKLFKDKSNVKYNLKLESLEQNSIRWEIRSYNERSILLQVFNVNKKWELIGSRVENFNIPMDTTIYLLEIESLNDIDIILTTSIGLFIYHLNKNNKKISLNYFYYIELYQDPFRKNYKIFLNETLPSPNYISFKISNEWVLYVKDNKESLLKYGVELLKFAIKEQKLELIDNIYKKCIEFFKDDLKNNRMFLNIITSAMPYLSEYFPDYISRYSLATTMIIDYPTYNIEYQHNDSHLYSFQYPQIVNLTKSILWFKYNLMMDELRRNYKIMFWILIIFQILLILTFLPIYFAIFYILSRHHFINNIYLNDAFSIYFEVVEKLSRHSKTIPIITFMVPYVKFVNYPKDYNWFLELISPQPSPFVNTISSDIYKTLDGEALINFKWNTYGKYYHSMIWIGFMAFLVCFNAAAEIPQQYIDESVQKQLLIASIILGFIHLGIEIRQFIYYPAKWISDIGNMLGMYFN
ncbi:hypothetical protein RirG_136100 [Rhizophagus irregularis DAOM 197198w]|uniref:Ion transport domain-containing protein n=1 Tax=Rhizophagus irregularis (strain DAOM 197198w) TaxID=1432141 RepID=A0A015MEE7_RHIIW|nr:hypothetical protein RirG_136100 [Rhizophagus irregularis DAOM 197198w]